MVRDTKDGYIVHKSDYKMLETLNVMPQQDAASRSKPKSV